MDKIVQLAGLEKTAHSILDQYSSSALEASVWNNIPIKHLEQVRAWIKPLGNFRIVYRGPRYDWLRSWTKKSDAVGFSVYER